MHGEAEIFGTELIRGRTYTFAAGYKAAVFTFKGCTIKISFIVSRDRITKPKLHARLV